ncbi:MAG TPA: MlaD family protein [Solirubrobacterales bacterium]|jgi:ABC-type transporter Mla subunit MlaD
MKKVIAGLVVVAAVVVAIVLISGGGSGEGYVVRAVFDNGSFMVAGEQVRVAGANVGTIKAVSVSLPGEPTAEEDGKLVDVPGKAIIELEISNPSFQDFRQDAGCEIRPQSLIGEKFVDCHPTEPRAPGVPPPPPLKQIPEGEPGAGQYLLPLGRNQTTVDPDLVNNINSLPYAQRFRLIFNELGAGLAGRGEDLEAAIKKANPTLRSVDKLFGELTEQKDQLAQLAAESQEILEPLTQEKEHVVGFLAHAGEAAEASSEHGAELESALQKFPTFLVEFRETMKNLKEFSDAGTPLLEELGVAAPSLTTATKTLTPFSEATTVALKSLGTAGEASGPVFAQATPVVKTASKLAKTGVVSTRELAALFGSLKETKGWQRLTELIYNSTGAFNGFDKYGHYGRALATLTNCLLYVTAPGGTSGCNANFHGATAGEAQASSASIAQLEQLLAKSEAAENSGGTTAAAEGSKTPTTGLGGAQSTEPSAPVDRLQAEREEEAGLGEARQTEGGTEPLLGYLLGQ